VLEICSFNGHKCLTPSAQIIGNTLNFLFRYCLYCMSAYFFKLILCTWIICRRVPIILLFTLSFKESDSQNKLGMKWTNTTCCFTEPMTKFSPRNTHFFLEILHNCQFVCFQKETFCGCLYKLQQYKGFCDKRCTVCRWHASERSLPYYLIVILKEYVIFALVSALTRNPVPNVDIRLLMKKLINRNLILYLPPKFLG